MAAKLGGSGSEATADYILGVVLEDLPHEVVTTATQAIADSIGVMLAGRRSTAGELILNYARGRSGGSDGFWVAGSPMKAHSAELAAIVNGTLGHALDFDDAIPGVGHPSVPILSSILATAQDVGRKLDGESLIAAFVVGVEVMDKVARALGVGHSRAGWHMTSTAGTFGAVAAACRTSGLDRQAVCNALSIAGSLIGGLQRNFGTSVKPLHSGLAARNGVLAAHLAGLGATAADEIFDGPGGVLDVFGSGTDERGQLDRLGHPLALQDPGTALKKYPCCYVAARPIDALLRLRSARQLVSHDVAEIVCRLPVGSMRPMIHSNPSDGEQAKFSMEYLLAAAMCDGTVGLESFEPESLARGDIRKLMRWIRVEEVESLRPEDPLGTRSSPATGGSVEVKILTAAGATFSAVQEEPHGSPRNRFTWEEIQAKFMACAEFGQIDRDAAQELFLRLTTLHREGDVLDALSALSHRGPGGRSLPL